VPLSNPIPTVGTTPVLSDADFQTRREVILHRMA